jgi:hypothetical protein
MEGFRSLDLARYFSLLDPQAEGFRSTDLARLLSLMGALVEGFPSMDLARFLSVLGALSEGFRSTDLARPRSPLGGNEGFLSVDLHRILSLLFCLRGLLSTDSLGPFVGGFRSISLVAMQSLPGWLPGGCFFKTLFSSEELSRLCSRLGGCFFRILDVSDAVDSMLGSRLGGDFLGGLPPSALPLVDSMLASRLGGRFLGRKVSESSGVAFEHLVSLGECFFRVFTTSILLESSLVPRSRRPLPENLDIFLSLDGIGDVFFSTRPWQDDFDGFLSTTAAAPDEAVLGGCFLGIAFLEIPGEGDALSTVSPIGFVLTKPSLRFGTTTISLVLFMVMCISAYNVEVPVPFAPLFLLCMCCCLLSSAYNSFWPFW